ncbi:hypothetical protein V8F20_009106 [Naviculisporaceae sp. PSN 640]
MVGSSKIISWVAWSCLLDVHCIFTADGQDRRDGGIGWSILTVVYRSREARGKRLLVGVCRPPNRMAEYFENIPRLGYGKLLSSTSFSVIKCQPMDLVRL